MKPRWILVVLLAALAAYAHADVLITPLYYYSAQVETSPGVSLGGGPCLRYVYCYTPGSATQGSASAGVGVVPGAVAEASTTFSSPYSAGSEAGVEYGFEFVGPDGSLPVDIQVALMASLTGSVVGGGFSGGGDVSWTTMSALRIGDVNLSCGFAYGCYALYNSNLITTPTPGSQSFAGTFSSTLQANTQYLMFVSASSGYSSSFPIDLTGEAASGFADPHIYLDPSFGGASNYTLELSPGIGNAVGNGQPSSVPEPGTMFLVLNGASLLGFGVRRFRH